MQTQDVRRREQACGACGKPATTGTEGEPRCNVCYQQEYRLRRSLPGYTPRKQAPRQRVTGPCQCGAKAIRMVEGAPRCGRCAAADRRARAAEAGGYVPAPPHFQPLDIERDCPCGRPGVTRHGFSGPLLCSRCYQRVRVGMAPAESP